MTTPHRFHALPGTDLPRDLLPRLLSPALLVFLDRVRANVRKVLEAAGNDPGRWRPHVKTAKIPEVFGELAGAGIRTFKCATTREAACLLDVLDRRRSGDADLLLAYPLVGPALERLGRLAAAHPRTRLSVLCEDPADLSRIPEPVSVFVDLNPGMNRTGLPPERWGTAAEIARRAGSRFRGLHFYDGHLHGLDPARRRREAFAGYDRLAALIATLPAPPGEIVTSGTPTFLDGLAYRGFPPASLHRVSPGTVVYHDLRSEEEIPGLGLSPAALVFARVVSLPASDVATCDAGSKSMAAEAGDPCALALGRPGWGALAPSEEHLPFRFAGPVPERGTPLLLVPRHVCPTVNLAERAVLMEGGVVRGVVPVAARAHEILADGGELR